MMDWQGFEDKPVQVRAAVYLGPSGMVLLMLSAFTASSTWVCKEECVHIGIAREDRLLECVNHCEVQGSATPDKTCRSQCHTQVGFTRSKVRKMQSDCEKDCARHPTFLRFTALVGTLCLLPVAPLLSAYRNSCRCECCLGQGCSQRLAFYNIGWVAYGFSCLWILPAVLEDPSEVGGKVLLGLAQGIAMSAMAASRRAADEAEARGAPVGEPTRVTGAPGNHQQMNVIGASATGPSNQELQAQIQQLQQQVRDLVKLQTLQVQAAAAAPASTAVTAAAAPPGSERPPPPQQLL
mmetsp:Transcript_54858/g.171508  ORF Transcript_54858/g.171508 Transcript_54858/m.171508 type:complete len:294 (-) Transcript_54858:111-992(-)